MTDQLPENQEQLVLEFFEYQKQDLANKSKELDIRRDEIQSNERIALASIEAQKADSDNKGVFFAEMVKSRHRTIIWIAVIIGLVLIIALLVNKAEVAADFIAPVSCGFFMPAFYATLAGIAIFYGGSREPNTIPARGIRSAV